MDGDESFTFGFPKDVPGLNPQTKNQKKENYGSHYFIYHLLETKEILRADKSNPVRDAPYEVGGEASW